MDGLALILSAVTLVLAAIHVVWALGLWWPLGDETRLARAVVGRGGATRMPGAAPLALVAVGFLFASALPWLPAGPFRGPGLVALALVFQLRAVLAYAPPFKAVFSAQPFRRLDERLYGPLAAGLGAGYMVLASAAMHGA